MTYLQQHCNSQASPAEMLSEIGSMDKQNKCNEQIPWSEALKARTASVELQLQGELMK